MKLFDDFEVVKFSEENLIFVTNRGYLYYIYNPKYKKWSKHKNAGNDFITVNNYQDVGKEEIVEAMGGIFPTTEVDFMRLCHPSQLWLGDMVTLCREDYPQYMSDSVIYHTIYHFLSRSTICHKSYAELKKLLDNALISHLDNETVLCQIKDLSLAVVGKDIFRREIEIINGHYSSSYFWIMPVRVVDYSDSGCFDNVAEMKSVEISIEEDDVAQYLKPFLDQYFDKDIEANKKRVDHCYYDEDDNMEITYITGFEWYLTHNYYTFDSINKIIEDIGDTIEALSMGKENRYTARLRETITNTIGWLYKAKQATFSEADRCAAEETEIRAIIDFYRRFIYKMQYMMQVGKENGFDLISVMGP